jgi:hypothetical protein
MWADMSQSSGISLSVEGVGHQFRRCLQLSAKCEATLKFPCVCLCLAQTPVFGKHGDGGVMVEHRRVPEYRRV